jgi:hypothetical protein
MYVHGYALDADRARGAVQALCRAGFAQRDIEVRPPSPDPATFVEHERREGTRRDTLWGAIFGVLTLVPLGVTAPGMVAHVQLGAWFERLVSHSVGLATLESLVLGALVGGGMGALVGWYRDRKVPVWRSRVLVGVHASGGAADKAVTALQQSGTTLIETEAD